ncbi:MAG: hypothetical protein E7449_06710, partial [Ruminococcaceae bacterium]|nr:hypothetical protein [Oscillospiraceae bacterium]
MKKIIALLLVVVLIFSMAACAKDGGKTVDTKNMTAEQKALAEAEIRYAIGLLFDRNYIVEEIGQAGQVPASS